ncbi:MAG: YihA family ribosome biogenesis GTP-binding protein [Bacteroidetes bacterium]|jgi:GTP-binding protein|nr:MAG: YihA family ribosome biogenesis GTP-binding protein [Bacteroidota bacterium]PTM19559.1 MAG: YihA family ribosome biogenesis GTP-binding protein [Bacteroidota bacterium]
MDDIRFQHATFVTGAPALKDCPPPTLPEFCFAGRSNVGKSSLINRLTNKKKLARTSNTPGKTQQMNYYLIDDRIYIVDLPGFGFAQAPKRERERWGRDIQTYLLQRETLRLIFHLVDIRHEPTALDRDFFYWMASNEIPFAVLLSKADKVSGNKRAAAKANLKKTLAAMNVDVPILVVSAESADAGSGINELQSIITEFSSG